MISKMLRPVFSAYGGIVGICEHIKLYIYASHGKKKQEKIFPARL